MTERAVGILRQVDLIAAEDTRHTRILLNHFQISGHVVSYHEHNKKESGNKLIEALKSGRSVLSFTLSKIASGFAVSQIT